MIFVNHYRNDIDKLLFYNMYKRGLQSNIISCTHFNKKIKSEANYDIKNLHWCIDSNGNSWHWL